MLSDNQLIASDRLGWGANNNKHRCLLFIVTAPGRRLSNSRARVMASGLNSQRPRVDWARFGLSEQNSESNSTAVTVKPAVLDETSYGAQETQANELFTEEQVSSAITLLCNCSH